MNWKMEVPELRCMDPENYRKCFRALCWSGTRKLERPYKRRGKKDRVRRPRSVNPLAVCYAPALLNNPSQFAVYATVRKSVLARWRHLYGAPSEYSDDSDNEDSPAQQPPIKVPKVTGVGLRTVFELLGNERYHNVQLCENALNALLDILQGYAPEELAQEPPEIMSNLRKLLREYAQDERADSRLITLGASCLAALAVARGEVELILDAVATLIVIDKKELATQLVKIPLNLVTLQRSVHSVILGPPSRNRWLNYGVPLQSLVTSFPVDLPSELAAWSGDLIVRALVSDGCYLYVYTSRGLLKIGSGYGSSIKQHVYLYDPYFFPSDRHGWLGVCNDKLFLRQGRKSTEIYVLDKSRFTVLNLLKLDPGKPAPIEPKTAVFTDGHQLGMVMLTDHDNLTIRLYDVDKIPERLPEIVVIKPRKELTVPLMRRRTLTFGRAAYEDGIGRRGLDSDTPAAMQLDDNEDDPLTSICGGQDFGLLTTASGKVYYSGKGSSLGFKLAPPYCGRWTMIKETLFNKNDTPNLKKFKVIQIAVGHEGVHAILVLDNGTALFTGIARRGEDGDNSKHRRAPKPTKPKKIFRAEGHHVVYAACNYGSTALVTRQGALLMFGKDTQHCDSNGLVQGLKSEKVIQVALGKAHAVVLTNLGLVYTLGINNKGQCGREFGYTKEKHYLRPQVDEENKEDVRICQDSHTWITDYCRVCVQCRECTGFAGACHLSTIPDRVPGDKCGCGEGDAGCAECGICRQCAEGFVASARPERSERADVDRATTDDDEPDTSGRDDSKFESKEGPKYEGQASGSDVERDASRKVSCLPPAKVAIPGGHKVTSVACGLHHTVLLTDAGEVLTFGSNQYGQLGAGDVVAHHRIVRVRVPRATSIAAGSNHTAVITKEGELYTFGNYQKGSLGRPPLEETDEGALDSQRSHIWYATPHRVPNLGPRHACKATWLSASGDQTFVQISQALIKIDSLFSATIIANNNSILILPNRPEHTFKCITINKTDGSCNTWSGPEQVDFVNTLACLDPHYEVLWCYQPLMRVMKCYNILAFDSHKLQRCCNPDLDYTESMECFYPNVGAMRRLEEFKNMENFEVVCNNEEKIADSVALSNISILNQELAIPVTHGSEINRMHLGLHLLGCLDSLIYAHDNKVNMIECKRETVTSPVAPLKADYLTVTRFQNHGGGWGYSGHSVEAIRFMCDSDILLGGYGLFGGRGDYTAKIKLFDIGPDGGDQEGDGELITETEEIVYECAPRDRFPVMFDSPIPILANRWYVAWACINGPSSDCGSAGQAMIINDDVGFHFKTSKRSNNGTDVNAGQIPSLLYNLAGTDHAAPPRVVEHGEPVITLTKNISRKVTVACFKTLLLILNYCWDTLHFILLDTNGLVPINFWKLGEMKKQKRLVYIVRACLRLAKSYINEIYPQNNKRRNSHEYMHYFESIGEIKLFIQSLLAYETPTCDMLEDHPIRSKKSMNSRVCYVQFALELTNSILKESQETFTACFYAFCPTPSLKWDHFVALLHNVKNGKVPPATIRELTATCAAMCSSRSLRDVLQYIVPITQNSMLIEEARRPESKVLSIKDVSSKSATVPRVFHGSKPPPIPPRSSQRDNQKPSTSKKQADSEWHLLDVVRCLLDIVMLPIKEQMMTRQRGQPHDHGEIKLHEQLSEYCCKLTVRIIAELSYSATNIRDMESTTMKQLVTPSRFMRMNQSRSWNTGNGSPDAICFTVDRPGVTLVGACVYTGVGNYEYTLELLHDMRLHGSAEEANPANCWVSIDTVNGTFNGNDCQQDMAQLKFDKPIPLKEDLRYALRLCNHGGRTANGDCGLPSVKGTDGTTFRFASCSLSFNGTTLARGQIPCLIYHASQTRPFVHSTDSADAMITTLRAITLRVSSFILERTVQLFFTLRNDLTSEDLRRNSAVLQQSPAINILLPYCLANLDGMDDSKSVIKLLELVHKLLPHVSAINLLLPTNDEFNTTTTNYYTWVESEHPYHQATVTNKRVLFPPNVSWIVLEMDPRSVTAQPEDTLTIYAVAGTPKQRCHCQNDARLADPPFRKVYKRLVMFSSEGELEEMPEEPDGDNACMHYNCTYVSVTPKLGNVQSDWPQNALLVPGNEVIFSLETATDYLTEYNKTTSDENRFGFRCLCAGYEDTPLTSQKQGLVALEMELVYAGASYASKLLAPDLDMPPMVFSTLVDVQLKPYNGPSDGEDQDHSEALLLSRGLELSSPLSVHQVLDGQSLLRLSYNIPSLLANSSTSQPCSDEKENNIRCVSTERQFLIDFIAGAERTAGGRLARWLAPTPQVVPAKCEIKGPPAVAHPNSKLTLPILVRDQYGDPVACPSLKVEVVVQKLDDPSSRLSRACSSEAYRINVPDHPFQPTVKETMRFNTITMMKGYQGFSFEELRLASGAWGEAVTSVNSRIPAERLVVRPQADGCYVVSWTPKVAGVYAFRCTIDELPIAQELLVDVTDSLTEIASECGVQTARPPSPPIKIRRFNLENSAGLRIRASPSLQAEEIGRVAQGEHVAFIEEISNKDGTWVRLSECSLSSFTDSMVPVAWCLAHHCHLDRVLLERLESETPDEEQEMEEFPSMWSGYEDKREGVESPPPPPAPAPSLPLDAIVSDDQAEAGPSCGQIDESQGMFPIMCDFGEDNEPHAFGFAPEPSKRDRQMRNEAAGEPGRRSNGNDWWEPVRHRPDNGPDIDEELQDEEEMAGPIPTMSSTARRLYSALCENKSGVSQDVVPHGYYRPILHDPPPVRQMRLPHNMPGPAGAGAPSAMHDTPAAFDRRRDSKSPVLSYDLSPVDTRAEPSDDREKPPELQPKMKCREPRVEPSPCRQPDPTLRENKPPVHREHKPELPFRGERLASGSPRDLSVDSPRRDRKPQQSESLQTYREIKPSPRHQSEPREPKLVAVEPTPIREAKLKREQDSRDLKQRADLPEEQPIPVSTTAAGTQTSPDAGRNVGDFYLNLNKDASSNPRSLARERVAAARALKRTYNSPPPPLPARTAPAPPPPKKHALSPAQAECLRAIFAALLWHEGIVHDAIACAAFLKFHPQLPKQGARVVTRPPHDVTPTRHQRHSVEVSNAGHYLRIHPSTLETLTRSGVEASASRARKSEIGDAIREEDVHANIHEPGPSTTPSVVSVLPPALRALVALWDALYDSDQLSAATDKYKKPIEEIKDVDEPRVVNDTKLVRGAVPKKVEWKAGFITYKAPYSVRCELCGGASVPPPLAAHMRHLHPGCRAPTQRGYDRAGIYKRAEPPPTPAPTDMPPSTCGQLAQDMTPASSLWYVYCERCRDKTIKAASAKQTKGKASLNSNEAVETSAVDHHVMRENAVFLLDLAPLTNSESISSSAWYECSSRSPPTPPGSVWQPAPPFQCMPALGAAPKASANVDAARYHSLGRPAPQPVAPLVAPYGINDASTHYPRVHRSVSMGQAGGRDLWNAARRPQTSILNEDQHDTLSGAGSSLLAQPSAELQRLVGCGESSNAGQVSAFEPPRVDPDTLIKSPVLSFVLAKRDLPVYRQKMDAAVRINTVRQYAFEAMNWLLRSTTQPTCVHDVMWWFCTALDKYARLVPPPSVQEDNKENVANEASRLVTPTASTAAICPGGRAARGARAAFHAFLGSVSALAPSLSPASAASLQAVRCWALHYSQEDRAFLHRSQVFNVISKILSHSEDTAYDEDMVGAIQESLQSFLNKEHYVWACPDVTGWCDISVSSRAGMAGSLIDGSTETFWESGDEDRNKAKWIQVSFPGGSVEDRPSIVCVHVDNTRDTVNKTLLVSFMYSGSSGEMYHMQDMEVDPKVATWVCYTLPTCYPGANSGALRVRCELRGPEPAVRVRQVRVLSIPAPLTKPGPTPSRILHGMAEADTLRVFRLLTSEVFGKLLEWERSGSESGEGPVDDAPTDDSDLREHVVGILFAGHQLTSLQREVMTHIVSAIGAEAARVRDDWETALLCAETAERADQLPLRPVLHQQDNYCFEMLSLLLALSGSQVGRSLLAQQTDLLADLLALLHTGSERVQRQVISLLRRIISEIPPQKMLAAINPASGINERITLLDHLLCYLGKAITVQMKVKGTGGSAPGSVTMGTSVVQGPHSAWFMRGETTKKHAHLVAKLLSDMAEEKVSPIWGLETRAALANYAAQVAQINETDRRPDRCIALPTIWMSLAALCVCEQAHIELLNGADGREARSRDSSVEPRPFCVNHDDGTTTAVIECRTCGALCAECDRFLHLNRVTRAHHRQICKEEESAIRIDIHEGCGRAKLFWLLLLVDRRTLKGLAEFRGMDTGVREGNAEPVAGSGPCGLAGVCRFCGARGNAGLLAIGNVCADHQCQEHGSQACNRLLACGHLCGGVRSERACLPCLLGCSGDPTLRQDADDMCMICFTDPLQAAPAIQLGCGHVFHLHCCKKVLSSKWIGPRITFSFAQCPICKEDMNHWTLAELLAPINRLREEVQRKALMRFEYEGLAAPGAGAGNAQFDPAKYAMERYAYYVCHKCEKAYFGGLARCEAESNGVWEPSELVCGACSDVASAKTCPKHGADFLEYKCRYCCSVAVFFCFGTSHFCNACHDDFQRVTNIPRHLLPQCPAGPKGEQLPGSADECPLHVVHPPTGEEFALGCGVCRHAHVF